MRIIERRILKSLQHVTKRLPSTLTPKDSRFVIDAINDAMEALIAAEEPINKTRRCYDQAERITEDLDAFVQYKENHK